MCVFYVCLKYICLYRNCVLLRIILILEATDNFLWRVKKSKVCTFQIVY